MSVRIEVAHDIEACRATVPIQEEVWSGDVVVPPQLLLAVTHNGGFVAVGHVDGDERPAGFVFGFLGIYDHHFRHHSHMLAVRAPHRHSGLAVALKEAQRDHCLDQGIDTIAWTMDPLEARNARFNFAKLGAFARTYGRDWYGAMPDKLNEGLPSDRLYVEWRIATDRADKRLRGADAIPTLDDAERDGIAWILAARGDRPAEEPSPPGGESHALVAIPMDFQAIKAQDLPTAVLWRDMVRQAFELAFAEGYAAVEFLRSSDGSRGAYMLVRQPQHPSPEGTSEVMR
ncbi:MAG: GNAT family N-acetyltransferase [Chloroflexi bacterium]|nr:GNAT family N-acetyltransferase [Chloroflexota bacterium]